MGTEQQQPTVVMTEECSEFIRAFNAKYGTAVNVVSKRHSALMRALAKIVGLFNTQFLNGYITTVNQTIYVPEPAERGEEFISVLQHEAVHVLQAKRLSVPLFWFLYLFPQSLTPLALLSLVAALPGMSLGWLWWLVALVFAAPLPAPFRYKFEVDAFRTSIIYARKRMNFTDEAVKQFVYPWIINELTGSAYYWCWPFKAAIAKNLENEQVLTQDPYKEFAVWLALSKLVTKLKMISLPQSGVR